MNRYQHLQAGLLVVMVMVGVHCGGGGSKPQPPPPPPAVLQSIQISPASASFGLCKSQQFTATGTFSDGSSKDVTNSVTWESSVPIVARVSAAGLASSQSQGSTTIRAKSDTVTGTATVAVGAPALSSIAVTPLNPSIATGGTQQFFAMGTCVDGTIWNLTRQVTWSSSSASASVTPTGMATGLGTGNTTVAAALGSLAASSALTVTSATASRFLYTTNYSSSTVSGYSIDPTSGALVPLAGSPFSSVLGPFSIVVDPAGRFAYIAAQDTNTIVGYSIDPSTGNLTALSGSPFPAATGPSGLRIDPTGHFLYAVGLVADANGNRSVSNILGYSIDAGTGALTPLSSSFFPAIPMPTYRAAIGLDPTGRFAYIANGSSSTVSAYKIRSDGALVALPDPPIPTAFNPIFVTADPAGQFLYLVDDAAQCSDCIRDTAHDHNFYVSAYLINGNSGSLTEVPGSPFPAGSKIYVEPGLTSGTVDPAGRFIYVTKVADNLIGGYTPGFSISSATGALVALPGSPFRPPLSASLSTPLLAVTEPTGHFIYESNYAKNSILGFSVDGSTGALSEIPGSPFPVLPAPSEPTGLAIASPR